MTEEQREPELDENDQPIDSENSPQDDSSEGSRQESVPISDYKNLQAVYTQTSQEVGALKERLNQVEQAREESGGQAQSDALDWLDSEEVQEEIDSDPASIPKILKQAVQKSRDQLEGELVQTLKERDGYYHQKFLSQDPGYQQNKDRIDELRNEVPAFRNLSDEAMMEVVEREDGGKSQSKSEFRGNPGSGKAATPKSTKDAAKKARKSELYSRIYGEDFAKAGGSK